jgi:large-conductance mechanosensitive channel
MAARNRKRRTNKTQVVTAGTTIHFEEPASDRKEKPGVAKVIVQEMNPVDDFTDFLRKHAIVGLSIAFIIGNQMASFVKVLVENFIDPLTKLLFGTALSQRTFTMHFQDRAVNFGWGIVFYNIIIIMLLLVVIFAVIKIFSLDKLDPKKEDEKK